MIPAAVSESLDVWLTHHDRLAPNLIEGLYVVGSAVLNDWQPDSDIDIIAITGAVPGHDAVSAMEAAHLATNDELDGIKIDGPRLTWADISSPPRQMLCPWTLDGEFHYDDDCFELNQVMWQTLGDHGHPIRGPEPVEIEIALDPAALRIFVRENTDAYWRSVADSFDQALQDPSRTEFKPEITAWAVLGVARMLYTVQTGDIASKSQAGLWFAERFPEHRGLIEHAVMTRRSAKPEPDDRRTAQAATDYLRHVIQLVATS